MKIKGKFLWFYSVFMFSVALLLILISSLSQLRLPPSDVLAQQDEQQAFNQTIQKSITDLIKENENLREEISAAKEKISKLEEQSEALIIDAKQNEQVGEATEFLIEAEMLFNTGKYAASRDILQNANALVLTEQGKQLYDWISEKLAKKGYKLKG